MLLVTMLRWRHVSLEAAGLGGDAMGVDDIGLEFRLPFDEANPGHAHCEGRGGETVGLQHIAADDGQAHDILDHPTRPMRIVDVGAVSIGGGGGDAAASRRHGLDDLLRVEWVANADRPILPIAILAAGLDVAAGIEEKVPDTRTMDDMGSIADGPPRHDAGRVQEPIRAADLEIAAGLAPG